MQNSKAARIQARIDKWFRIMLDAEFNRMMYENAIFIADARGTALYNKYNAEFEHARRNMMRAENELKNV